MKKLFKQLLLSTLVFSLFVNLTGCSSSDDDDEKVDDEKIYESYITQVSDLG